MNDFTVNTDSVISKGNSVLLDKILQLFGGESLFEKKTSTFLKWVSDSYYPNRSLFIPQVGPNISEGFPSQICEFGFNTELLGKNAELISAVKSVISYSDIYKSGLTSEIIDEAIKDKLEKEGISSFFVIPLVARQKTLGFLAFIENDITRLWSEKEKLDLLSFSKVFAQYFYTETLEKELFSKEDVLQKAIENSNDGYWHIDLSENQMHFSRQWKRMLGFDESEIEDSFDTFEKLLHPDDKDLVLQVLDPYMKIGVGSYECEYRIRNKAGKYLWVLTRANVNFSDNGIPIQFVATNTDITSRIEYKRKLSLSEAKFKMLIGSIHEIIFEIDYTGMFTFLNEAWERHLLLKVDKSIGTESSKYIHPEDRAIFNNVLSKDYPRQEVTHLTKELRFIAANGKSVWMEAHFSIQYTNQHEVLEVKGTLVNIDERKLGEIAKQASENKLARISENISDLISEIDEKGNYLFMSNSVRGMMGKNPEVFIGKNSLLNVHPDDRKKVKENVFEQLINGANRVVEQYRVVVASGKYIWVESIVQPLLSASGKRTFISASRDISARRKVEEDMQLALKKEQDLNELKSRFITMTSHEFRTPLSSIQSSVQLLEMYADDLGERFMKPFEKHFGKITTQVSRINNLLNNIDTLGKIESLEMPFNPIKQNLEEFVRNIINQKLKETYEDRNINIEFVGESRVPVFDPSLMDNLLCNVFKNSLLYSQDDIECKVVFNEKNFEIIIKDTGLGIPEDEIEHLFTSFFRAKNIVNLNIPGNGLGLIISKKIVDIHGGTIQVSSIENEGTSVTISFPNEQ